MMSIMPETSLDFVQNERSCHCEIKFRSFIIIVAVLRQPLSSKLPSFLFFLFFRIRLEGVENDPFHKRRCTQK